MGPQFPGSRAQALPKVFRLPQINPAPTFFFALKNLPDRANRAKHQDCQPQTKHCINNQT
jgi:hypothetical protein